MLQMTIRHQLKLSKLLNVAFQLPHWLNLEFKVHFTLS